VLLVLALKAKAIKPASEAGDFGGQRRGSVAAAFATP
jgi:hypothetical protein